MVSNETRVLGRHHFGDVQFGDSLHVRRVGTAPGPLAVCVESLEVVDKVKELTPHAAVKNQTDKALVLDDAPQSHYVRVLQARANVDLALKPHAVDVICIFQGDPLQSHGVARGSLPSLHRRKRAKSNHFTEFHADLGFALKQTMIQDGQGVC